MSQSPAQFAVRTLRALEVLAFAPASAPQVAEALGVHPRTARRLLSQLRRDGWLYYNPRPPQLYAPTLRLVALAAQIGARAPLAVTTAPAVKRLHVDTGLDALVAIPSYTGTVSIVRSHGARAIQPPLGEVRPAHCTAFGKALMAHRAPWRQSILTAPLTCFTARTVTDPREMERELACIRQRGFATDDGEHIDGARELAAVVTIPGGEAIGAIGVAIHDHRSFDQIAPHVTRAARDASQSLAAAAQHLPLHRGIPYRLLTTYGLAPVDAQL